MEIIKGIFLFVIDLTTEIFWFSEYRLIVRLLNGMRQFMRQQLFSCLCVRPELTFTKYDVIALCIGKCIEMISGTIGFCIMMNTNIFKVITHLGFEIISDFIVEHLTIRAGFIILHRR